MNKKMRMLFTYIIILIAFILVGCLLKISDNFRKMIVESGEGHISKYVILNFIFYSFVGMLLGLEHLLCEFKKNGHWTVSILKLLSLGIPSFIFGIYSILYYVMMLHIPCIFTLTFINGTTLVTLMQILFGYVIITSFYRKES